MEPVAGAVEKFTDKGADKPFCVQTNSTKKRRARLRVLLIGHQFQVPSEGQAKASALAAFQDMDVHVMAPSLYREGGVRWRRPVVPDSPAYNFSTAPVWVPWGGPAKWYLQWYPHLPSVLHTIKPDVIDIWEEPWGVLSAQVCWLRNRLLPSSRIISETEQNISKVLPPPFEWLRRYSLKNADFLIGRNAEAIRVARIKGYNGPAAVVGNGVDVKLFKPVDILNNGPQGKSKPFVVGYAGRMVAEKGVDLLLKAVTRLPQPRQLVLSGDGPLLKTLLRHDFVKWMGALPREALPGFYRSLNALVLPSVTTPHWKEQFGRVLAEAQACGIPVVGSSSGAIPEVINSAGMVFSEGIVESLHSRLERLRGDRELCRTLGQAGRKRVCDLYSWESIAGQMRSIYQSVCRWA